MIKNRYSIGLYLFVFTLALLSACDGDDQTASKINYTIELPASYQYIGLITNDHLFENDTELICLDGSGNTKFALPRPDDVSIVGDVIRYSKEGEYVYMNGAGDQLPSHQYVYTRSNDRFTGLNPYQDKNGLWGYINESGMWVIQPQFSFASPFTNCIAYVEKENGNLTGFTDSSGNFEESCINGYYREVIGSTSNIKPLYFKGRSVPRFQDDRLLVQLKIFDNIYSTYITNDNQLLHSDFPAKIDGFPYEDAQDFSEGLAAIQINGRWGYIDVNGNTVIQPSYQNAFPFYHDFAVVVKGDGSFGRIDRNGNEYDSYLKLDGYQPTGLYDTDLYVMQSEDGMKNIIDQSGTQLLQSPVHNIYRINSTAMPIWEMDNGFFLPKIRKAVYGSTLFATDTRGILDNRSLYDLETGEVLFSGRYLDKFYEGLAVAQNDFGKYGYINDAGDLAIPFMFDEAHPFNSGLAFVRAGTTCGLISKDGCM